MKKLFELIICRLSDFDDPEVFDSEFYRADSAQALFPLVDAMCNEEEEDALNEDEHFGAWKKDGQGWSRERSQFWSPYCFQIREREFADVEGYPGIQKAS